MDSSQLVGLSSSELGEQGRRIANMKYFKYLLVSIACWLLLTGCKDDDDGGDNGDCKDCANQVSVKLHKYVTADRRPTAWDPQGLWTYVLVDKGANKDGKSKHVQKICPNGVVFEDRPHSFGGGCCGYNFYVLACIESK